MPAIRDPYAILGVERSSSDVQIKRAYRKLARKFHPDVNRGDEIAEARFQEIARAYEAISTEENRIQWAAENEHVAVSTPFPDFEQNNFQSAGAKAPDPVRPRPRATKRVEKTVKISFQQAFNGFETEINVASEDICSVCGGSGAAPGHKPHPCDLCSGTGQHRVGRVVNNCSNCNGKGYTIDVPCRDCQDGIVVENRPYILKIPAGVPDFYSMKIETPQRGLNLKTIIEISIEVEESPIFKRTMPDPADLVINVPISYSEAALGGSIKIPTPTRVIALKIPAGTPSGKPFRISGEGMPKIGKDERGDLYAQTQVIIPNSKQMSASQEQVIQQLKQYDSPAIRENLFNPKAKKENTS